MNERIEQVQAGHPDQNHAIDEAARHEAEIGRKLLQNLSSVDQSHAISLTFKNVIKSTDTFTMLNCIALIFVYMAAIMEYSIPTSQIAFIIADLGKPELASWLSTASTAATAAILPSMSSFTDVFGRRYALLFGSVLGTAGALIAGFAPSTEIVILGQALSGAGVGFTFISAASLAEMVPAFTRPFWGTLQHSAGNLFLVIGPVYSGALVKSGSTRWRWMFYINAIAYGIGLLLILFIYREKSRTRALGLSKVQVLKRFDYLGLLLLAGGTITFLCGLSWGGDRRYGWKTAHAIAPTVIGCISLFIALPVYEAWVVKYPLVDRRLFKSRNFVVLNVQTFIIGFVQFSTFVYLPQILLAFWESDPLMIGVDRLPLGIATLAALTGAGMVFQKTGKGRWAYFIYAFFMLLGPALFAILRPNQPIGVPLGLSVFTGLGIGGATGLGFVIIQYSIPQQLMGIGIGSLTTLRSFGGSVSVAIFNSILRSKQISDLPAAVSAAALAAGVAQAELPAIVQAALSGSRARIAEAAGGNLSVVDAVMVAYKAVLSDSYRLIYFATIPFGVISLVMTFFLQEVTQYMSNETVFGLQRQAGGEHSEEGGKAVAEHSENADHDREPAVSKA